MRKLSVAMMSGLLLLVVLNTQSVATPFTVNSYDHNSDGFPSGNRADCYVFGVLLYKLDQLWGSMPHPVL